MTQIITNKYIQFPLQNKIKYKDIIKLESNG